jgi:hypothetical protein
MKYVGFFIGLAVALALEDSSIYFAISGGLIGFLAVEVFLLSQKVSRLESQSLETIKKPEISAPEISRKITEELISGLRQRHALYIFGIIFYL